MREMFRQMLKENKEGGIYKIDYFNETVEVDISDADVEVIVDCAFKLMEEVESMKQQGLLSRQMIMDRTESLRKEYAGKDTTFYSVITGFVPGGVYDREVFYEVSEKVGHILGYGMDSTYWQLIGRTSVLSGILSVIEGYFINEDKENIYESCIWIYIRSCMYMKRNKEEM